jgi:hypothetical protein
MKSSRFRQSGLAAIALGLGLWLRAGEARAEPWGVSGERFPEMSSARYMPVFRRFAEKHAKTGAFVLHPAPYGEDAIPYVRVENGVAEFPCAKWKETDWNMSVPREGVWTNGLVLVKPRECIPVLDFLLRATRDLREAGGEDVVIYMPASDFPDWAPPLTIASADGGTTFPVHAILEAWEDMESRWNRKIGWCGNVLRIDHDFGADSEWWYNENADPEPGPPPPAPGP